MGGSKARIWPYRQDDPEWGSVLMWDRNLVIQAQQLNGKPKGEAEDLLREFPNDGNSIGNEGCMLTCLSMTLALLYSRGKKWNPTRLNEEAHARLFYSLCGLCNVALYADLVGDVTNGEVQLCAKEEYHSGEPGWQRNFASDSDLLRAYRALPDADRRHYVAMLKIGTYDDSVASHFVLMDPDTPGHLDDDNPRILDPVQPMESTNRRWSLRDSYRQISKDPEIKKILDKDKIKPLQLSGVWIFARWRSSTQRLLADKLFQSAVGLPPP